MNIKWVEDISQFIEALEDFKPSKDILLFFRGEAQEHESIKPSVYRHDGWINNEDNMFREFILRNPNEFRDERSTFEKLVKMQHYSYPTRLLDITSNPLVALYSACEKYSNDKDGELFVFSVPISKVKFYDSDTVSVVSNIAKRPVDKLNISGFIKRKGELEAKFIERFNKSDQIKYLLHEIKEEKPYFLNIIQKEHLEDVWCVKPLLKNARIIKQDGAFLLFGIKGAKNQYVEIPKDKYSVEEYEKKLHVLQIIGIKKESKLKIMNTLEHLGISKDKLYPELDTTAEFLKDKYRKTI